MSDLEMGALALDAGEYIMRRVDGGEAAGYLLVVVGNDGQLCVTSNAARSDVPRLLDKARDFCERGTHEVFVVPRPDAPEAKERPS